MNTSALHKLSYGLYIVCSRKGDSLNGQIANSVMQLASEPPIISVCINKQNGLIHFLGKGNCQIYRIECLALSVHTTGN